MITSISNKHVKRIRLLQNQRSARQDQGCFVVEGTRLLDEAVESHAQVELVLYEERRQEELRPLLEILAAREAQLIPAASNLIAACSETESPQGVMAVVALAQHAMAGPLERLLIVDRLRDPGNLGSLMRSALASGVQELLLTPGTVDALNPKVVRGAMGAHFHLRFRTTGFDELAARLVGLDLWIAEAGKGVRYDSIDWRQPAALLIGSEAHGPSEEIRKLEHKYVHIPMSENSDSLNAAVAGSIILFEIARQRGMR